MNPPTALGTGTGARQRFLRTKTRAILQRNPAGAPPAPTRRKPMPLPSRAAILRGVVLLTGALAVAAALPLRHARAGSARRVTP